MIPLIVWLTLWIVSGIILSKKTKSKVTQIGGSFIISLLLFIPISGIIKNIFYSHPVVSANTESGNTETVPHQLIGIKYIYPESIKIIEKYGNPETLSGTNNVRWVAYFPKGNFTIISNKETNLIKEVLSGKKPQ